MKKDKRIVVIFKTTLVIIVAAVIIALCGCDDQSKLKEDLSTIAEETKGITDATEDVKSTFESTVIAIQTEVATQPPTEAPKTRASVLESGLWIKYSPQAPIFEAYEFNDGIIERKEYLYENGSVEEYNSDHTYAFMTYEVNGDNIEIHDNNGREWTWHFTDDDDILEFSYEDTMGGETYFVKQLIRHHDSVPNYDTAMNESKKGD